MVLLKLHFSEIIDSQRKENEFWKISGLSDELINTEKIKEKYNLIVNLPDSVGLLGVNIGGEWDDIMGFSKGTVERRLNRLKWSVKDTLTKKIYNGKYITCEKQIFPTIKKCAEYYKINYRTMKSWLEGYNRMPKEWVEKGLAFYEQ